MTEAKYEELVSALTDAGVALRDMNGEYRSTYDIMADISAKWSELTSMQKAALATNLAGTRQQNVFYSIIEQFQEASGAMTAMTDSAGALQEAHEKYLDSIEGKLNQLKATFQELSTDVLNSKMFKSLIGSLTKVVSALKWLLTFADGFVPRLAAMLISGNLAVRLLTTVVLKVTALYKSIVAAGSATAVLKKGLTALSNHALLIALTAIVTTIVEMKNASERAAEYLGRTEEAAEEEEKTLEDLASQYRDTQSDIDSLNSQLSETDTRLTTLLKKDKLTIIEQAEVTRLQTANDELERQLILKQKLLSGQQTEAAHKFASDYSEWETPTPTGDDRSAWTKFWDQVYAGWYWTTRPQDREGAQDLVNNAWGTPSGNINVGELSNQLYFDLNRYEMTGGQEWLDSAIQRMGELEDKKAAIADIDYNLLPADAQAALKEIEEYELRFTSLSGTAEQTEAVLFGSRHLSQANEVLHDIAQNEELTIDRVLQLAQGNDAIRTMIDEYRNTFKLESDAEAVQGIIEHYSRLNEQTQDKTIPIIDDLKQQLESLRSTFRTVESAIKEYNENGHLSSDSLEKLLALEPEYLNLLVDENGQLNLNSQSYETLIKAKLQNMLLDQMQNAFDTVLLLDLEAAGAYAAAQAYDTETASIYQLIMAKSQAALADAQLLDQKNHTNVYTKAIMRTVQAYQPLIAMVDEYTLAADRANKTTSDGTEALQEQKKALEDAKEALSDYKEDLNDAKSSISDLIDLVSDYIKQQKNDEKEVLEERKKNFDDLIDKEKEELQIKKEAAEFEKTLKAKQNTVAKNALAASIASLDDSAAGRKAQKSANNDLISSRDDLYETLANHEYDIRVKALDQLKEKNDEYYDNEIKKIEDYLKDARHIYEDACYLIENGTGDLYDKLWGYTYAHTTKTKAEFDHLWASAQTALDKYGVAQNGVIGVMEILQTEIYITEQKISGLEGAIKNVSDSISRMANQSLGDVATQIGNIRQEYADLMSWLGSDKWVFRWKDVYGNDQTKYSIYEDQAAAINDILNQLGWDSRGSSFVRQNMQHLASGTLSARGGLAEVNEDGHEIRILNKGDGILTAKITRNLSNLGSNPAQFLADAGKELLSKISGSTVLGNMIGRTPALAAVGSSGDMPITIVNHINGDVNPSTLKALEAAQERIVGKAMHDMMQQTLVRRSTSRVR